MKKDREGILASFSFDLLFSRVQYFWYFKPICSTQVSTTMTSVSFLYTQSDRNEAERLKDLLQAQLRTVVNVKSTAEMITDNEDVRGRLTSSNCVVLIGSRRASSLIKNNQQEIEDGYVLFDGRLISEIFTAKHGRLVIVFFSNQDENDWIPPEFDRNKIFHFRDGEIQHGSTTLDQLVDCIRGFLL